MIFWKANSSIGKDARFSFSKEEFDSLIGYNVTSYKNSHLSHYELVKHVYVAPSPSE